MRKFYLFMAILGLFLSACSQTELEDLSSKTMTRVSSASISEDEAIDIALNAIRGLQHTRTSEGAPEIEYVLRNERTRSSAQSDTLAYIINYPDNGGYALVANTNVVEPLMVYSDKGNLDQEDLVVKETVIKPLEAYLASLPDDLQPLGYGDYEIVDQIYSEVTPQCLITMNQYVAPWNTVVVQNKGEGVPAGCVPMAMAFLMTHCKKELIFDGRYYNFDKIIKTIALQQGTIETSLSPYTYDFAVSQISNLLYDLWPYVVTWYSIDATFGDNDKALNKLIELGYQIPVTKFISNDSIEDIKNYLKTGHLIYGNTIGYRESDENSYNHAMVYDGYQDRCRFIINNRPLALTTYLHARWGEDEYRDAYYNTRLLDNSLRFSIDGFDSYICRYFPVKIEK